MHKQPSDPAAAAEALKFFHWAYANGGKMAQELDYVPMPANVVAVVERLWAGQIQSARSGPLFVPSK
jgi:phosphate transport system substrate-binding protein